MDELANERPALNFVGHVSPETFKRQDFPASQVMAMSQSAAYSGFGPKNVEKEQSMHQQMIDATNQGVMQLKAMARTRFRREGTNQKLLADFTQAVPDRRTTNAKPKATKPKSRLVSAHSRASRNANSLGAQVNGN